MGHVEPAPGQRPPSNWKRVLFIIGLSVVAVVGVALLILFGLVYFICSGRR
jgi:hypothetical protein